jgi:hypothetical protein
MAPLIVLVAGAALGALVVAFSKRGHPTGLERSAPASAATDLRRRYDSLIRQLSEGSEDTERASVEIEAARVLRELDRLEHAASASASTPQSATPAAPAWVGFLYGLGTMAIVGGLVYFASRGSSVRREGGSLTGNLPGESTAGAPADRPIASLEEAVRQDPKNADRRIELARAYLQQRDLVKVFEQTQAVLEVQPGHPHALTYQALVRVAMGQPDQAEAMLVTAIKANPKIEDAYIHLAIARLQRDDRAGAEKAIADGQAMFPEDREALAQVFQQISGAVAETAASGVTRAAPAAVSPGPTVDVTIELTPGASVPKDAVLFVIVREAGFATGPPVAVKRVPAGAFPLNLSIGDADSMAGESLPGLVRIDARIDRDGDPLTKDPRDPVASEDNVRKGSPRTKLVLGTPNS